VLPREPFALNPANALSGIKAWLLGAPSQPHANLLGSLVCLTVFTRSHAFATVRADFGRAVLASDCVEGTCSARELRQLGAAMNVEPYPRTRVNRPSLCVAVHSRSRSRQT